LVLQVFLAICLLGLLLFLIQVPGYYREAQEARGELSLTRTAVARMTPPTPVPTPTPPPTPEPGGLGRFFPPDLLLFLILAAFVFFFMRTRRR
jgi:hypothetical protein